MSDEYVPTNDEFRIWVAQVDALGCHGGISLGRFERWLAMHDAEVTAAARIEGAEAMQKWAEFTAGIQSFHGNILGAIQGIKVEDALAIPATEWNPDE